MYTKNPDITEFDPIFNCKDCGINTNDIDEYYMVLDSIWLESGMDKDGGMLCLECLEIRIGRRLIGADFKDGLPINEGFFPRSERMLDRLERL